jgi:hypothetical protein
VLAGTAVVCYKREFQVAFVYAKSVKIPDSEETKIMQKLLVAGLLITALTVIGCGKGSDSTVIAKIGRTKITVGEFKERIGDDPQLLNLLATNPQARKDILDQLVTFEIVLQEAKNQGFEKDAEYKKNKTLAKKQMELQLQNILINMLLKKELAGKIAPPTEKEIAQYYNTHRKEMITPEGKKVSLKEASNYIGNTLGKKKAQEATTEYANGLKAKMKIVLNEKALESLSNASAQPSVQQGLQMQHPAVPAEKK